MMTRLNEPFIHNVCFAIYVPTVVQNFVSASMSTLANTNQLTQVNQLDLFYLIAQFCRGDLFLLIIY